MPGTPTTAAPTTPTTQIRILLSTDHTVRGAQLPRTTTSVLPRSAARHLLQPADSVLHRRVRREQLAHLFPPAERGGDHKARLIAQLRLPRQRGPPPPPPRLAHPARPQKRI